ncbi:integrin beta-2-like isoform X1 [Anguilla rostrata]|uniref:integrin beta-2-like isoform X1 n=2 Tax=Anguilla rostrata TaxID=7938 RepID=UPI0030CE4195
MFHVFHFTVMMGLILLGQCSHEQECSGSQLRICEECIASSPGCAWCKDKGFDEMVRAPAHCDTHANLRKKGCQERDIIDPESRHSVTHLSGRKGRRAHLSPQNMSLELRPGRPLTFELQVKRPKKSPVEVYYLTSFSFVAKHSALRGTYLGGQVVSAVQEVNPEAHGIGFGLFGDQQSGCGEGGLGCKKVFSFSHFPSLEPPADTPKSGTPDPLASSDAGLQALLQAVVCGDLIGWGEGTRLLVYVSNHGFSAADQTPDNSTAEDRGRCHLTEGQQHFSRQLDYPTVAELAYKLTENNIQVLFAVTKDVAEKYKELSDLLPKSTVTVLPTDLRNIKAVITDAYRALSSTLVVSHTHVAGLKVSYSSECDGEQESSVRGACSIPEKSRKFSLNVTVSSNSCLEPQALHLQLLGSQDRLPVDLKSTCHCQCGDAPDPRFCSDSGNLRCGVCSCDPGHFGEMCECSTDQSDAPCRKTEGSPVCSGRGSCVCGDCECQTRSNPAERIFGQFCECDNFSCDYHNGIVCGGHGRCVCGSCFCDEGFVGAACDCSTAVDQCRSHDGSLCSNHGSCQCNMCKCEDPYHGPLCDTCPTCQNDCGAVAPCAECLVSGSGRENCLTKCANIQHTMVDILSTGRLCHKRDAQHCVMSYSIFKVGGTDSYKAQIKMQREC